MIDAGPDLEIEPLTRPDQGIGESVGVVDGGVLVDLSADDQQVALQPVDQVYVAQLTVSVAVPVELLAQVRQVPGVELPCGTFDTCRNNPVSAVGDGSLTASPSPVVGMSVLLQNTDAT